MLIISPRSYVTAAFDLLFPALAKDIGKLLKSIRDDWWDFYIYENREAIFGEELRNRENFGMPIPLKGDIDDLEEHFDENYLIKLCRNHIRYKLNKINSNLYVLLGELKTYRNDWAHRGKRASNDVDVCEKLWAELAIQKIKEVTKVLNTSEKHKIQKRLSILLFKMKCDWIDDSTKLPSHKELLDWLYNNIVGYVLAPNSPVNEDVKARVEISFDNITKFAEASLDHSASKYVIDYYWNAIRGKTDVYDEINKHGKIKTFEDVVEDFTKYCYKE